MGHARSRTGHGGHRGWNELRSLESGSGAPPAVERSVEIIGEAARHVSRETRDALPDIPWRQIIGMRNILAHEYGQVDHARLFETVVRDMPLLIERLSAAIPSEPDF